MKGVMNFLEKTGFVRTTEAEFTPADTAHEQAPALAPSAYAAPVLDLTLNPVLPAAPLENETDLSLAQIYARAGVQASAFPAEKLLRLMEGLKTMDEATRRMAVTAMDAADDSWTIEDPIRDAVTKVQILREHCAGLRQSLEQAHTETQQLMAQAKDSELASVSQIKQQIADLEGLLEREIARSAQEQTKLESSLQAKRDEVRLQVDQINGVATDFQRLIAQFGAPVAPPSPQNSAS